VEAGQRRLSPSAAVLRLRDRDLEGNLGEEWSLNRTPAFLRQKERARPFVPRLDEPIGFERRSRDSDWGEKVRGDIVRQALVLAAGNGDRFVNGSSESKLLQPLLGQPLILRTIRTAHEAGISRFEIVLGYRAETLRAVIEQGAPPGPFVHFTYNPDWQLENGVSVLAARHRLADGPFALLMGDHVFEAESLSRLMRAALEPDECALGIDCRTTAPEIVEEATKVRLDGSRVVAIGKDLRVFDALDTGMFVCSPSLFDALARARAEGDTTLSGGIRQLGARRLVRGVDIGEAAWYDIDTPADLEKAETSLAALPEHV
jgi:choline kinase